MGVSGFDERWNEIQTIHKEYRLFYQIFTAAILLLVGFLVGKTLDTPSSLDVLFGILLGVATGLATNLASWWILFHRIAPVIQFSNTLSKTPQMAIEGNKSGFKYRFKIINSGRRPVIDVELMARLRIRGLGKLKKTSWWVVYVPIDSSFSWRIPKVLPNRSGRTTGITFQFSVNDVDEFRTSPMYPEAIQRKAKQKILLLEDVLSLGNEANIQVVAYGYDEFSGTRKLFLSKRYSIGDIREGLFRGYLDVVSSSSRG